MIRASSGRGADEGAGRGPSAVKDDVLGGDIARGGSGEEDNEIGDLVDVRESPQWHLAA